MKKHPYYYGSFYCSYKEDGSAFVWIPRWTRTTTLPDDENIKRIIKECLESAPIDERKYVGMARLEYCKYIGLYADDHDMRCVSYEITSDSISSGSDSYKQIGIQAAYDKATKELVGFVSGDGK